MFSRTGNGSRSFLPKKCENIPIMTTNLVTIQDKKAVTSSLQVSNTFEKRHDHVIRDVENLKKDVPNFGEMFVESSYLDSFNRKQRMYIINRDGFTLLAMGFTGKKALQFKLAYIAAFNKMEEYLKNQLTQPAKHNPRKRIATDLPQKDVLQLNILALQFGFDSIYQLLQILVYNFIQYPHSKKEQNWRMMVASQSKEIVELSDKLFWKDFQIQDLQDELKMWQSKYNNFVSRKKC